MLAVSLRSCLIFAVLRSAICWQDYNGLPCSVPSDQRMTDTRCKRIQPMAKLSNVERLLQIILVQPSS